MARYKQIDNNPRFLPVDLVRQLLPGTFEFALNHLLDQMWSIYSTPAPRAHYCSAPSPR